MQGEKGQCGRAVCPRRAEPASRDRTGREERGGEGGVRTWAPSDHLRRLGMRPPPTFTTGGRPLPQRVRCALMVGSAGRRRQRGSDLCLRRRQRRPGPGIRPGPTAKKRRPGSPHATFCKHRRDPRPDNTTGHQLSDWRGRSHPLSSVSLTGHIHCHLSDCYVISTVSSVILAVTNTVICQTDRLQTMLAVRLIVTDISPVTRTYTDTTSCETDSHKHCQLSD